MPNRLMKNYGWVQNTSNLVTVRETLLLVPDYGVEHLALREEIKKYRETKGNLPRLWTWDARCRIKAIHALGLVKLNRHIQGYELSPLGKRLKNIGNNDPDSLSPEEVRIFKEGLLTSPPVIRILSLLNEDFRGSNNGLSKYDLGAQLGFVGDIGFTHIDPYWVANNNLSFNDKEGDADKWARTILSWLVQVGWAYKAGYLNIGLKRLAVYKAGEAVNNVLRYDASKIVRNVAVEMLCSDHHPFPKLIQKRRSEILFLLSSNAKSKRELVDDLALQNIEASQTTIEFEILNLKQAGFRIIENGGYYSLLDKISLDRPDISRVESETNIIEQIIEENVVKYEDTIPTKLVDHLIRYGYDGDYGSEFEATVSEFFRFLGYNTTKLGQGGGRVADVLARYIHPSLYAKSYALVIDAKATATSYKFPAGDIRKMKEYINTHGPELAKESITKHAFSFISSDFGANVDSAIREVVNDTHINGCAIKILQLLELGRKIKTGNLSIDGLYSSFAINAIMED